MPDRRPDACTMLMILEIRASRGKSVLSISERNPRNSRNSRNPECLFIGDSLDSSDSSHSFSKRPVMTVTITDLVARDLRFPTSRTLDGSDAMNVDPDYSAAYVVLETDSQDG